MSTTKKGTVQKFKLSATGKTGWKYYKVAFEDGEILDVAIGPRDTVKIDEGVTLNLRPSKYEGQWNLITPSQKPYNGQASTGGGATSSSTYWESKFSYEKDERDPEIQFQEYFKLTVEMYSACVAKLKAGALSTTTDFNKLLDGAYEKAQELCGRRKIGDKDDAESITDAEVDEIVGDDFNWD